MLLLDRYINDINRLCASHKVRQLFIFGSALSDRFSQESDVDFIVDFEPMALSQYADNYYDLKFSLQDILQRPIDLLEAQAIKNPYFKKATDSKKHIVYG